MSKDKDQTPMPPRPERLHSLDALRGFIMLCIIGLDYALVKLTRTTAWDGDNWLGEQFVHSRWEGLRFYDCIFPMFIFISGVSIPYAFSKHLAKENGRRILTFKTLKRVGLLILLGLLYSGALDFQFSTLRFPSVLGQIGIAYGIAALGFIYLRGTRKLILFAASILGITALLQCAWPGSGEFGPFTKQGCINGLIDRTLMGNHLLKWTNGVYDPEGLLCAFSAASVAILGVICGKILKASKNATLRTAGILTAIGAGCVLLGLAVSPFYPVIKRIWTASFCLASGGIACLVLAAFYLVIDVWKLRRGSTFLIVIGLNSIFIYLANHFIPFHDISRNFFGGIYGLFASEYTKGLSYLGGVILQFGLLWFLYTKHIFFKI